MQPHHNRGYFVEMRWLYLTLSQIKEGGLKVFEHKLQRALHLSTLPIVWALMSPVAIIGVIIIRAIRPWVLVRIGTIRTCRIGHFCMDASLHLAYGALKPAGDRTLDFFWIAKKTSNEQWARMVRRQLSVHWWVAYLIPFNDLLPGGYVHQVPSVTDSRDIHGLFNRGVARFKFTPEETASAKSWLLKCGWKENMPYVCCLMRDNKYLSLKCGEYNTYSYHDYRNSDIDTYIKSFNYLVSKGYWVIRMGKAMQKALSLHDQHVIDYPFVTDQHDLIDIWLTVHCHFFISTGTGLDTLATVYNVPTVYVNALPLSAMTTSAHCVWVPKNLIWKETGRFLTLREHLRHSYYHSHGYEEAGIVIKDLTDQEVISAVEEMDQLLTGTWVFTIDDEKMHNKFWEIFKETPNFSQGHGWIHPQSRVGTNWLRSMGDDFFS